MITKLVYVLTCAPDKTYIEQALMSVYSARHWNPDSHIILITDDNTKLLLTGVRGEILNYIDEKIVVPFFNDESMMYRSRFIKTQVRELVKGDFLFIDCDTVVCKPLADLDNWDIEIGAVYESHLKVNEFCEALFHSACEPNLKIGVDLSKEEEYFSSGVLYVKDTPNTHQLYALWHQNWLESQSIGVLIDQPSLCKANIQCKHIIKKIPDTYNTILFTRCSFTRDAHILHIAAYRNPSFLFSTETLDFIKRNGLHDVWLVDSVLSPCNTFLPFDYDITTARLYERMSWICILYKYYREYNSTLLNNTSTDPRRTKLSLLLWMMKKCIKLLHKRTPDNVCKKS